MLLRLIFGNELEKEVNLLEEIVYVPYKLKEKIFAEV